MPERAAQQQKSTDTVTDADLPNLGPDPTKLRASAIQLQPAIERYSPDNRTLLQNGTVQYRNVTDNASKFALHALCRGDVFADLTLIDCQMPSEHLSALGMSLLSREEFEQALQAAISPSD